MKDVIKEILAGNLVRLGNGLLNRERNLYVGSNPTLSAKLNSQVAQRQSKRLGMISKFIQRLLIVRSRYRNSPWEQK